MSTSAQEAQKKPVPQPSSPTPAPASKLPSSLATTPPSKEASQQEGPLLFHFAECTNCRHLLPISTNTEKYFGILSKAPKKPTGLGEKCARCGADSWVLVTG